MGNNKSQAGAPGRLRVRIRRPANLLRRAGLFAKYTRFYVAIDTGGLADRFGIETAFGSASRRRRADGLRWRCMAMSRAGAVETSSRSRAGASGSRALLRWRHEGVCVRP